MTLNAQAVHLSEKDYSQLCVNAVSIVELNIDKSCK